MTSIFHVIPSDILINWIIQSLPAGATFSLSRVSKTANAIVQAAAGAPQEDITLAGKRDFVFLDDKTISALLRQKVKIAILTNQPELLVRISTCRCKMGRGDRNNIADLINYATEADTRINRGRERAWNDKDLALAIVPFDYHTKQIPASGRCGLASLLCHATKNPDHVRVLFSHPDAIHIPADGLGYALISSIVYPTAQFVGQELIQLNVRQRNVMQLILSHPNAVNIPPDGSDGLGDILKHAILYNQPDTVREILSHPNAVNIPADGEYGLESALELAKGKNNPEIIAAVSSFIAKVTGKAEASKDEDPYGVREQLEALNSEPEVAQALAELIEAQPQLNDAEPVHEEARNAELHNDIDPSSSDEEEDDPALDYALNAVQNARHNND